MKYVAAAGRFWGLDDAFGSGSLTPDRKTTKYEGLAQPAQSDSYGMRGMARYLRSGALGAYLSLFGLGATALSGCEVARNNNPVSPTPTYPASTAAESPSNSKPPMPNPTANYHAAAAPNLLGDIASQFVPGPPAPPPFYRPAYGVIEMADCEFNFIIGYAIDPSNINASTDVHFYVNGEPGSPEAVLLGGYRADIGRKDVGRHGYKFKPRGALQAAGLPLGKAYALFGYVIALGGKGPNSRLTDVAPYYVSSGGQKMPRGTLVCHPEE